MRLPFILALFLLFAPFTNITAHSEEILIKSTVKSVTIFPSGAQIVRSAKLDLVAGDHTIIVRDLPERLITSSLRVEGAGGKTFEIGAVDSKHVLVDVENKDGVLDKNERQKLENEIENLTDQSNLLSARIKAAQTQSRLMERLTDLPGQSPSGPGRPFEGQGAVSGTNAVSVEKWGQIFDLIGTRMAVADDLILKYRQEQRKKQKEITRLKKRLAQQPPKKERQMEVRVAINAPEQMKAGLKIKYQVREASWRPFYDARLTTGQKGAKPQLSLTRRAGIRQWSGEDWTDVKIALSTTRPQQGAQAPVLHPKRLDLVTTYPAAAKPMGYLRQDKRRIAAEAPMMEDTMAAPAPVTSVQKKLRSVRARERQASVKQYAFQAVFGIPGKVTVLPTGNEKKVAISSDELDPVLKIKTVPKLNATAFLYAKFTHAKKATPLLPGSVALYRDGTFSGNGTLPLINAGDEHALGFGTDDAVKVTRVQVKRTKGQSGIFSASKGDEQRFKIKVTNLHDTPIELEVVDQIPYSVNEKVVVRLLPSSTKPSRQNIKDRRGILAWDFTLGAGKDKQINLDYTISWPADQTLSR